jgi:hypothetical protein
MSNADSSDVEKGPGADHAHLTNTAVRSFSWDDVTVTVKDRESKQLKDILCNVNGMVKAGTYSQLLDDFCGPVNAVYPTNMVF